MTLNAFGAGTAAAASGASPTTIACTQPFEVGSVLVVAMAYDNSGASGADPLSAFAVSPATGSLSASLSTQTGLNDPGASSAGVAARCNAYKVMGAIPNGTNISISWTGTVVVRATAIAKIGGSAVPDRGLFTNPAYRTNSGATGTNQTATSAPTLTTPSVNNTELVMCWVACEYGVSLTGDADTTNGSWDTIITTSNGSTTSGISVGLQWKTVTGTATQTFNPTNGGNVTDWILGALIFAEEYPPVYPMLQPMIPPMWST